MSEEEWLFLHKPASDPVEYLDVWILYSCGL